MKTKSAAPAGASKASGSARSSQPATATKSNSSSSATKGKGQASAGKTPQDSDQASGLRELFIDMLKDIYWAEKALTKALPKMVKNASSEDLVSALQDHLEVTKEQVSRLEQVFEILGKKAQAKKCDAMEGLISEAEEMMQSNEKGMVRDAAIIAAGQKVEHYEIASYGTLSAFAKTLGEDEAAGLLEQTLEEEKEADQTLTTVTQTAVNVQAGGDADEEDEEEEEDDDTEDDDDEEADVEEDDEEDDEDGDIKASSKTAKVKPSGTKK